VVEEMALMVVAENWVPYESAYEKKLVDALAKDTCSYNRYGCLGMRGLIA
jgi:hypothetical protein